MGLEEYHRKRKFGRTPEPPGGDSGAENHWRFVVQKHAARNLHYDLRLELDGVLKSWAVPKGPSLDPQDKRLAVHVEDHPLDYLHFEGVIPPGEYGGGAVLVWDTGTWRPVEENGYERGDLKFVLDGHKLQGRWMLVHTGKRRGDPKHWLLFKERDEAARTHDEIDVLQAHPLSVLTERTIEQVAEDADAVWTAADTARSQQSLAQPQPSAAANRTKKTRLSPGTLTGAQKAAAPKRVAPLLPTSAKQVPSGKEWVHEIKFDGYRMLAHVSKKQNRFLSRNGKDWSSKLPMLTNLLPQLGVTSAILDGEVCALGPDGNTNFQALQNTIGRGQDRQLKYYVFDLIYLNGYDLRGATLLDRKELLHQLLNASDIEPFLFSEHITGDGQLVFEHACQLGAEGIVSKRAKSKYTSGRGLDWQKIKSLRSAEVVIVGYTDSTATRQEFGALVIAAYSADGQLTYVGRVGTGFNSQSMKTLFELLQSIRSEETHLNHKVSSFDSRDVHWVKPELVAEVEFANRTAEGLLRFPAYRGLRDDVSPEVALIEKLDQPSAQVDTAFAAPPTSLLEGMKLTHPDRIMYPAAGITKVGVASHYLQVAPWIVPHLAGRPLSLVRCPKGCDETCFFQKKIAGGMPDAVEQVLMDREGPKRSQHALVIQDVAGLMALVQFSALEIHLWGARIDRPDRPDRVIFDLDPDEGLPFERVTAAAWLLKGLLDELELTSFVKTTGGKGLHVVVPIRRTLSWADLQEFAGSLSRLLVKDSPGRFTASQSKAARRGKIYIDHLRNRFGATAIAPYSTRARPNAGVAMPVGWEELDSIQAGDIYTINNIGRRLANQQVDPWADFFDVNQTITRKMIDTVSSLL